MLKINLGGGNFHRVGWKNVDFPFPSRARKQRLENIDIVHNFMDMKPLPLENDSVDLVYSEHCIEHLTDAAVEFLVKDSFRILRPGGTIRISCPDADIAYSRYSDEKLEAIGFNGKLAKCGKGIELLDVLATPLVSRYDNLWVLQLWSTQNKTDFFNTLSQNVNINKDEQSEKPGAHLSWWNGKKLFDLFAQCGFREVYTGCSVMAEDFLDKTKPEFSVRAEGLKPCQ